MAALGTDSVLRESGNRYLPSPDSVSNTPAFQNAQVPTSFTPESDKEAEDSVMDSCTHSHEDDHPHHDEETISRIATTSRVAGQAITPFLKNNIPAAYAPTGSTPIESNLKDPSTKFCYRHRPDLKCRRTANEPSMDNLQRVRIDHTLL